MNSRILPLLVLVSGRALSRSELERACLEGLTRRCDELADQNNDTSVEVLQAECEHQMVTSCTELGRRHAWGVGVAQNQTRAAELFRSACDRGYSDACAGLSMLKTLAIEKESGQLSGLAGLLRRSRMLHSGEVAACGRGLDLPQGVDVSVKLDIEPDGSVSSASIVENTRPDLAIAECIRQRALGWQFPRGFKLSTIERARFQSTPKP